MMHRDVADAAGAIDLRVDPFGTHLRTWDASVLVHFAAGDRERGCGICDHPPALTQTFPLSHATLAVIDVLDGYINNVLRRTDTFLLANACFAGGMRIYQ